MSAAFESDPAADAFRRFEWSGWQTIAEPYDRLLGPLTSRVVDPLLDAAGVGSGTRVLDVATGPGYVAAAAAARGAIALGVDFSPAMVELARSRHPMLDFAVADAEDLPFPAGSFDAVVGNFALLHLSRPERAACEFARVLAPGGRLALTVWDVPQRARFLGVLLDAAAEVGAIPPPDLPPGPPFFRFADEGAFAALLEGAGLSDVAVETLTFDHDFDSAGDLWSRLLEATVRTRALIANQQAAVQDQIRHAYERRIALYRVGAGIRLPVAVKLASGRRTT